MNVARILIIAGLMLSASIQNAAHCQAEGFLGRMRMNRQNRTETRQHQRTNLTKNTMFARRRAAAASNLVPTENAAPTTPAHKKTTPPNDQTRAEGEARYMANHNYKGHVGNCIGNFEGVGWAPSGELPGTCTPCQRMTLTADATADNGSTAYRVRAWR